MYTVKRNQINPTNLIIMIINLCEKKKWKTGSIFRRRRLPRSAVVGRGVYLCLNILITLSECVETSLKPKSTKPLLFNIIDYRGFRSFGTLWAQFK